MTLDHPKVKKIIAQCERRVKKLTGNAAVTLLIYSVPSKPVPFSEIVYVVCMATGLPAEEAFKDCRKSEYILTRQLIYYYAKNCNKMTLNQIAQRTGFKHHTTVISGLRRLNRLLDSGDGIVCDVVFKINQQFNRKK